MSTTYSLICHETKQTLWIGQGTKAEMTSLYNTSEHIDHLKRFINATAGKQLVFTRDDDFNDFDDEYADFERTDEKSATPGKTS